MPSRAISSPQEILSPAQARRLIAYNHRVFDRYVRRVRALSWREATRKRGIGHESYFATLVHILNVQEVWIGYILRGRDQDADLEPLFADRSRHPTDWAGFQRYRRHVRAMIDDYLAHATARDLARPVKAFWMPGTYVASDGLFQATFEEAHHLGEIIGAFWAQDREPPEMTWIRVGSAPRSARR
jgi:uncharacterized damage-inducible protein DinB